MLRILLLFMSFSFNCTYSFSQKKYVYYLDKNLQSVEKDADLVFYREGFYKNDKLALTVTNAKTNKLVLKQEFTDTSLQMSNGLFTGYYPNGVVESSGNYEMGKQTGVWEKWDARALIIDSTFFENGTRIFSIRYQYDKLEKPALKTINDFQHNKFSAFYFDESGNPVPIEYKSNHNSDVVFSNPDEQACFCRTKSNLWFNIQKDIENQSYKLKDEDFGTVFLQFVVSKKGKISDVIVLNKKETIVAKVVSKYIRNSPRWKAGTINGEKVNSYRLLHYTFVKPDLNKTPFLISIAN